MKKIKVLIIITGGLFHDGITLSQLDYAKRIDKNKFKIFIVNAFQADKNIIKQFVDSNCYVIDLPNRKKKIIEYIKKISRLIKKENFDIIHVHGSSSIMAVELLIAKYYNVPVRIAHSRNTKTDHEMLSKILYSFFKLSYNVAFACGLDAGNYLFNNKKFLVFHNGKDLEKFKFNNNTREKIRNNYNLNDSIVIGHVGTFNEQKNHKFIIEVFNDYHKINKNTKLFLIGLGTGNGNKQRQIEIKNKVHELYLDDCVFFLGNINNVHEVIQGMDLMILPSLFEGLPNVVLEWQASGLPCLISDTVTKECKVSDFVEFLPINNGTKLWVDNIIDISNEKINRIVQSNEACKGLVKNGFEINDSVNKLEKLYIEYVEKYKLNKKDYYEEN